MKKFIALIICIIGCTSIAFSADLMEVYLQALKSDQVFQSAKETYFAATEAYPQARALVLPNIGLTADRAYNEVRITGPNIPNVNEHFFSYDYSITATQPVINFANWFGIHVASYSVKSAAATYAAAAQSLLLRTASAYFNILEAEDNLTYTQAQQRATKQQLDQATQRFKVGLDAITSVYEAQASYDSITADVIAAKNAVVNNKEQLRAITNVFYNDIATLKAAMPLLVPEPNNVETWVTKSEQFNFNIQSALFAADEAREQIKVRCSGHLPTVNLIGNYTLNHGEASSGLPSTNIGVASADLQLNLPIYQGGLISSEVRQAQYNFQNAIAILENTHRQVSAQLRQTYNSVIDGISKIKADKQAIKSEQSSVDSTDAAVKVGTRTIVDLLLAQQQLYQGLKNLATDQYAYIINTLTLKQLAGTLTVRDIEILNTWLHGQEKSVAPKNIYRVSVDTDKLIVNPQMCFLPF